MKELEKQRIEKIKSLDNDQIMNYVDVIIDDVCELHDFHSVINPDERINEITDLYNKLNEVSDLTDDEYNVMPYIKSNLDTDLLIVYTVNAVKDIVDLIESDNAFYNLSASDFEILSDVDFDEFMKSEMKFNLSKCKLWK